MRVWSGLPQGTGSWCAGAGIQGCHDCEGRWRCQRTCQGGWTAGCWRYTTLITSSIFYCRRCSMSSVLLMLCLNIIIIITMSSSSRFGVSCKLLTLALPLQSCKPAHNEDNSCMFICPASCNYITAIHNQITAGNPLWSRMCLRWCGGCCGLSQQYSSGQPPWRPANQKMIEVFWGCPMHQCETCVSGQLCCKRGHVNNEHIL